MHLVAQKMQRFLHMIHSPSEGQQCTDEFRQVLSLSPNLNFNNLRYVQYAKNAMYIYRYTKPIKRLNQEPTH